MPDYWAEALKDQNVSKKMFKAIRNRIRSAPSRSVIKTQVSSLLMTAPEQR
jgi:hypothetical protein